MPEQPYTFTERELYIVEQRDAGRTLSDLGLELKISPERVRQLDKRTRCRLRKSQK